jgi:hypothetical protein
MMCGGTTSQGQAVALGGVTFRPVSDWYGLSWNETIFGSQSSVSLDLKVDEGSKADLFSTDMTLFRPDERQALYSYTWGAAGSACRLGALPAWAHEAIRAGQVLSGRS